MIDAQLFLQPQLANSTLSKLQNRFSASARTPQRTVFYAHCAQGKLGFTSLVATANRMWLT